MRRFGPTRNGFAAVALAAALAGCGAAATDAGSAVAIRLELDESGAGTAASARRASAGPLRRVELDVTGPDMAPLAASVELVGGAATLVLDVPVGPQRRFAVVGFDAEELPRFSGETTVDLAPGGTSEITIRLIDHAIAIVPGGASLQDGSAVVAVGGAVAFLLEGAAPDQVDWSVRSQPETAADIGAVSAAGVYSAPQRVPVTSQDIPVSVIVEAVRKDLPALRASAAIRVTPGASLTFAPNVPVTQGENVTTESAGQRGLAWRDGRIYATWLARNDKTLLLDLMFAESADGGAAWAVQPLAFDLFPSYYQTAASSAVAVAPDGTVYVVFVRGDDAGVTAAQLAIRPPGEKFLTRPIPGLAAESPAVAVAPDGRVFVAWVDTGGNTGQDIWLQRFDRGGEPIDPKPRRINTDLGDAQQSQPALAVGPGSFVGLAWITEARVEATLSRDGGATFPAEAGVSGESSRAVEPTAALGADGVLHVAWQDNSSDGTRVRITTVATVGAGLSVGAPQPVGGAEPPATQGRPSVAVDVAGAVLVAFHDFRFDRFGSRQSAIWVAKRPPGAASFGHARVDDDPFAIFKIAPALALDTAGRAFVIWTDSRNDASDLFFSRGE